MPDRSLCRRRTADPDPRLLRCARAGRQTANGYYSLERMLRAITNRGGGIAVCGTCRDARGIAPDELAEWTAWAERVLVI